MRSFKSARIRHTYERGIKGFAVEMSESDAQLLARDPNVQFIEEDAIISASTAWGLDRIDQHFLPLNGTYVSNATGAGVTVYIVDTGILATHTDFGGRVTAGFNALDDNAGTTDCNGHGTHVAGIAGGTTEGVAKSAALVPVRVLDCGGSGSLSSLLAGLDWILLDHQAGQPAVVNMSLGGAASSALDSEVNRLISAGITTVVAAGNTSENSCNFSPARVAGAITVGASNDADQRASFSNYGSCVDLFAPGLNIHSDWYTSTTATAYASGTSAAAPFASGVAALILQQFPAASPLDVSATIRAQSTAGVLGSIGEGSPNRLLFSVISALSDTSADSQLLGDPGFDYGTTFWTWGLCDPTNPTGCVPGMFLDTYSLPSHSRNTHAGLGGSTKSYQLLSEPVTIPSSASAVDLSAFLWVVSKNKSKFADDLLNVGIRDSSGRLLETVGTYSNLDVCPAYAERHFDVTRYRGKTIRISFDSIAQRGAPTWFLLDDVSLTVRP